MAETSGFFNAEILSDGSYDRVYTAEIFAQYFAQFIGNGVYANPATQLQVVSMDSSGMGVKVLQGNAFINGYWYKNSSGKELKISNANGTTSRFDLIVVRLDYSTRSIYLHVIEGTPSTSPTVPNYIRNSEYYDIVLAKVNIGVAAVEITDSAITDMRQDNSCCGIVTGLINQIETTGLFRQFDVAFNEWFTKLKQDNQGVSDEFTRLFIDWFNDIKGQLDGDLATALQLQIDNLSKILENEVYGFENKTTKEDEDGTITEQFGDGRKIVTTEEANGDIVQRFYNSSGELTKSKTITELSDGTIKETVMLEGGL